MWISDDGQHEAYLESVLADGTTSSTSNAAGPVVEIHNDAGNYTGLNEQRSHDEVVSWRLRCDCALSAAAGGRTSWVGDVWQRAATSALEDVAAGRIYVAAGRPAGDVAFRGVVADIVHARWHTAHLSTFTV